MLLFAGSGFRCLPALRFLLEQLHELELVEALAKVRIVSVLDGVVGATVYFLGDVTPPIPMDQVQLDNEQVLLHRPLALANGRVQVIVPALTTLLSNAPGQALGHVSPVPGARSRHNLREDLVLLFRPGALGEVAAIVELQPARVALDLRLAGQELADAIPAVLAEFVDITHQFLVL